MATGKQRFHRRSIRMRHYDYGESAHYFVTICSYQRRCVFSDVSDAECILNRLGMLVERCWSELPGHFGNLALDEYVIMPNHLHGIITVPSRGITPRSDRARIHQNEDDARARHALPLQRKFGKPMRGALPTVIASFKSAATKRARQHGLSQNRSVWQRGYYERVIRGEKELARIRKYITENPLTWELDRENPLSRNFNLEHRKYFKEVYL